MADIRPVRIGLVGIGGFAATYVNAIEALEKEDLATFGAVVIIQRGEFPDTEQRLVERGITICATLEEMLALDKDCFDIVALPVGIPWHRDFMIKAAEAGYNVMLEKPSAPTIQDFDAMEAALARTGKWCHIGFQSISGPNLKALKQQICDGRLGTIKDVIVKGFWMRDDRYYSRNGWAGKVRYGDGYVLDGSMNNAMAHYLLDALYFSSTEPKQAATPVSVRAELYHAHPIESEDTACVEILCPNGVRVLFYGTLAARSQEPVTIEVVGSKMRAIWTTADDVKFFTGDTQTDELRPAETSISLNHFSNPIRYLRGLEESLVCPLAMTRPQVLAVNGAFLSMGMPRQIPQENLNITTAADSGRITTMITGIEELIERCAKKRQLFSDAGYPWAVKTKGLLMENFRHFEMPA